MKSFLCRSQSGTKTKRQFVSPVQLEEEYPSFRSWPLSAVLELHGYVSIYIPANGKRSLSVASQPALAGDPGSAESLGCCFIAPGPGFVSAAQPFHIFRGAKVQPFFLLAERKTSSEVFLGSVPRAECRAVAAGGRMFQVAWTREEFTHWPIRRLQSSQCMSVSVTVLCLKP